MNGLKYISVSRLADDYVKIMYKMNGDKNILLTPRQEIIQNVMLNGGRRDGCFICGILENTRVVKGKRICDECLTTL